MAGGQGEAYPLAGFQQLAGGNPFGGDAKGLQVTFELVEGGPVADLETDVVHAGPVGLTEDQAVMVALVPGLEVHPARRVAAGFHQPQHLAVEIDALLQVEYP